jgi:uncharacterized membrane protein YbjE (DUF340 family)
MKGSLIIVAFFLAGLILALFVDIPSTFISSNASSYALYFLMFLVGIGVGSDPKVLQVLRNMNIKIVLIPICVVLGTALGLALLYFIYPVYKFDEYMAIGAGYGYYSLSSIFITEIRGELLGVVALLSNIIREIITLLFTPIFYKYFGKLAPITSGGATAMDTTLPIITKFVGKEYAIVSVFSGVVLTILVPIIIPLILK